MLLLGASDVFVRIIEGSHLVHTEILGEYDTSDCFADFCSFDTAFYPVSQTDFKLVIILPLLPPKHQNYLQA